MKYLIFLFIVTLYNSAVADEHNYVLWGNSTEVEYRVQNKTKNFTASITAQCDKPEPKFYFHMRGCNPCAWTFFFSGKKRHDARKKINESQFLEKIENLSIRRVDFTKNAIFNLDAAKLSQLPKMCRDLYAKETKEALEKARVVTDAYHKKLDAVEAKTGYPPMFQRPNSFTMGSLIREFRLYGHSENKEHFVWLTGGSHRVSQVDDNILYFQDKRSLDSLLIAIITEKEALVGQSWSNISSNPVVFVGTDNVTTVLGAKRQVLMFKEIAGD